MPDIPLDRSTSVADGVLPDVVAAEGTVLSCTFLTDEEADALVVAVAPAPEVEDGPQPRAGAVDATTRYGVDLADLADRSGGSRFVGRAGEVVTCELPRVHAGSTTTLPWAGLPSRIVLVGIGDSSPTAMRRAGAALAREIDGLDRVVSAATQGAGADATRAYVEGYLLAAYRSPRFGGAHPEGERTLGGAQQLVLLGEDVEPVIAAVRDEVAATWLVRDLAATPSSVKTPAWLAARAETLAVEAGLDVEVLEEDQLEAQGFGGILAVGHGSQSAPRLVRVSWEPDSWSRHVVVVGKGITFDTGGLSIKPRMSMIPMKTDMAGAAVALATVLAAARSGLSEKVTAVLPLAENHFGASSYRPGDVLRMWNGTTVEIANTDAEGRLVLADALAWASATLDPDVLVDVATLTGAASMGLGAHHGALFTTEDALAASFESSGEQVGEPVWRMPLVAEYAPAIRSTVADLRHVPQDPPGGGAITAALFLQQFTDGRPWVHLDIAGPARSSKARHEIPEGPTGFGARLLLRSLESLPRP
ncbi:leucyl aminopeptidase family protein [Paraoerskovia marina]|uniref:leucyl aminopeptidase family protein n=1 Tax=Paraoerskovia marina TaxID=545619 RepID=UPI000A9DCD89|nr:leucyl aminopeptidase family protein [Paraoerskovia marina]